MKRILPLFILVCILSVSAKAGIVFGKVSGAEYSTQLESENSAAAVFVHLQQERKFRWVAPLKVLTEDVEGKKITTIIYKAAIPGPTLPIGPQIQRQNQEAAKLGVSPNPSPRDQAEIRRVLRQYESIRHKHK